MKNATESESQAGAGPQDTDFEATIIDFDRPSTLVGQRLDGRFLIEKNLADSGAETGGIGVVYLARDTKLMGKEVVVKILNETALKHEDIGRKFLHEKEALIRLDHPGIVRVLDSGTLTDGNPFLVMEFIQGASLRKKIDANGGPLSLEDAAHIIESVTDALAAAHSANIVHRDIKPENIMLTPQPDGPDRVRLIDFGVARVGESELAPATQIQRAIGTVLYIAPEQLIGTLDLTPAADIYAFAIVAYELVTGELPFKPKSITEMYLLEQQGVQVAPSRLRSDLPIEAERILLSALEFEADRRPQNIRSFGRDLAQALRIPASSAAAKQPRQVDGSAGAVSIETRIKPSVLENRSGGMLKWVILVSLIIIVFSIPAGLFLLYGPGYASSSDDSNASRAAEPPNELSYYLIVQKMRGERPFEDPFRSSGQEIFESGYKFSLNAESRLPGNVYLFNEGKDDAGNVVYSLLFPTPNANGGSPKVGAGQTIETARNTFGGGRGTEVMWLIWTRETRAELETIVSSAASSGGTVKDLAGFDSLSSFAAKYQTDSPKASKDSVNQRTVVLGTGDIIAHRFELEHR